MFSIYGVAGRVFNGSVEQLRRARSVAAAERIGALRDADIDILHAMPPPGQPGEQASAPGPGAGARGPLDAYAQAGTDPSPRHRLYRVNELMSQPAQAVHASAVASLAWQQLGERRLGQAPVLDEDGRLVGLLLRAELAPGPAADMGQHWQQPVQALMRTPVPAVAPDTEVRRVAQVLLDEHLPGLPVVDDNGFLLGFISRSDILRAVAKDPPLDLWA